MDIRVDRDSDVPVHEQIAAQLVFLIGTGGLKAGRLLPSVRALAVRLGVHRNTVGRAYHDVTLNLLVAKRAGARLAVLAPEPEASSGARDLDALLAATLAEARRRGYSLREVHDRLLTRLRVAPPDRILVVTNAPGMEFLLPSELMERLRCRVEGCTSGALAGEPQRALGAVIVTPPGAVRKVRHVLAADHPVIPIRYSSAELQLQAIRNLTDPSLIAIVSVSAYFIEMSRAVLAPAIGRRHSIQGHLVTGKRFDVPRAADVIVCDTVTYPVVRARCKTPTVLVYRLIAEACLDEISGAVGGTSSRRKSRRT